MSRTTVALAVDAPVVLCSTSPRTIRTSLLVVAALVVNPLLWWVCFGGDTRTNAGALAVLAPFLAVGAVLAAVAAQQALRLAVGPRLRIDASASPITGSSLTLTWAVQLGRVDKLDLTLELVESVGPPDHDTHRGVWRQSWSASPAGGSQTIVLPAKLPPSLACQDLRLEWWLIATGLGRMRLDERWAIPMGSATQLPTVLSAQLDLHPEDDALVGTAEAGPVPREVRLHWRGSGGGAGRDVIVARCPVPIGSGLVPVQLDAPPGIRPWTGELFSLELVVELVDV